MAKVKCPKCEEEKCEEEKGRLNQMDRATMVSITPEEVRKVNAHLTPDKLIHEARRRGQGFVTLTYRLTPEIVELLERMGLGGRISFEVNMGTFHQVYQVFPHRGVLKTWSCD